jgi:hypothetical protein
VSASIRSRALGLGLLSLSLSAIGCGARSYVAAPGAKYPVSLSSAVRGPDGQILADGDVEKRGTFKMDYTACSMLWTLIPFTGTKDISSQVDRQVANKGGEAITNLSVESSAGAWNIMTIIGVLPDCGHVKVRGDIVARMTPMPVVPAAPAAAPPAPTPPAAAPSATPPAPGASNGAPASLTTAAAK